MLDHPVFKTSKPDLNFPHFYCTAILRDLKQYCEQTPTKARGL